MRKSDSHDFSEDEGIMNQSKEDSKQQLHFLVGTRAFLFVLLVVAIATSESLHAELDHSEDSKVNEGSNSDLFFSIDLQPEKDSLDLCLFM